MIRLVQALIITAILIVLMFVGYAIGKSFETVYSGQQNQVVVQPQNDEPFRAINVGEYEVEIYRVRDMLNDTNCYYSIRRTGDEFSNTGKEILASDTLSCVHRN